MVRGGSCQLQIDYLYTMGISGIYKIESKIKPERIYIGSAINIKRRWKEHRKDLRNNVHHSSKLQNHYNKYGKSDIEYIIIMVCEKEELIKQEQLFFDSCNPYFNGCKVAYSCLGVKHSEESKKRRSLFMMGNKNSVGRKLSKEMIEKLTKGRRAKPNWNKGQKLTKEHKRKIGLAHEGKIIRCMELNHGIRVRLDCRKVLLKVKKEDILMKHLRK